MMSFLQNILQRHQLGAASQQTSNPGLPASYIVQPRPQSRFESDQRGFARQIDGARNDELLRAKPTQTESDSSSVQRAAERQPPLTADRIGAPLSPASAQAATCGSDREPGHGWAEGARGRMDAAAHTLDKTPFEHTPLEQQRVQQKTESNHALAAAMGARAVTSQSLSQVPQPADLNRTMSQEPAMHQSSTDHAAVGDALNRRIEAVLHAISHGSNDQPVHADDQHTSVNLGANPVLPNTGDQTYTGLQGLVPGLEPTFAAAEPPHQLEPAGSLQIPDWLADIQTELHHRWREISQQVESEPVVNVTIGRVEVRAVQDKPAKQAKARNRPSGVMTLDAYLKQRDRRGQA